MNYHLAREILGDDFITPQEIWQSDSKVGYFRDNFHLFQEAIISQEDLLWCHENRMMLVAGPSEPLSFLQLGMMHPEYLTQNVTPYIRKWYRDDRYKFARQDVVVPEWIALGKEPVIGSMGKGLTDQLKFLIEPALLPNIAEVCWGLLVYAFVRKVHLLPKEMVRTSSVSDFTHNNVTAGFMKPIGVQDALFVSQNAFGECPYDYVGLAAGRGFPLQP